jgi:hypothetical protein
MPFLLGRLFAGLLALKRVGISIHYKKKTDGQIVFLCVLLIIYFLKFFLTQL